MAPAKTRVEVGGRTLALSNLDKVLYPAVGFTKAEVIRYYASVAEAMLTHVSGRGVTLRRWPDGVDGESFFEKRCPSHKPDWLPTAPGPGDRGGTIDYCCLDEPAALVWTANLAALEIHAPMARADDIESPTMVVFDLDPGAPADIVECAQVALRIRDVLATVDVHCWPKTSGSKGMQVYAPLNTTHTHDHAAQFARAVAQLLEKQTPKLVTSLMKKSVRTGRIFVDWSQNSRHKTTIAAYSLRAGPTPTASTPVTWDETSDCADGRPLSFDANDVPARLDRLGDVFEPTATLQQVLPGAAT